MNGWIKWEGGECPVPPETPVFVLMRSGNSEKVGLRASSYLWAHRKDGCGDGDIVAYKLADVFPIGTASNMEATMEEDEAWNALQTQVGGGHYKDLAIQPIEYIHANKMGYCEANVVKYITRWRNKGGKQDLEKVKHYVDLLIQLEGLE